MEPMSGVEPLTYLITNYAVLNAPFFPNQQHFPQLTHDLPARMDAFSFARLLNVTHVVAIYFPQNSHILPNHGE
jgi:hypothetical protein